jgi:hypothetical protein
MEGTNQVLACVDIDTGLSTHGRIDHRQVTCRHLNQGDTAKIGGRNKAAQVSRNTSSDRDHTAISAQPYLEHLVSENRPGASSFRRLARRKGQVGHVEPSGATGGGEALAMKWAHIVVRNHDKAISLGIRLQKIRESFK